MPPMIKLPTGTHPVAIAGYINGSTITNCYSTGDISSVSFSNSSYSGGIAGYVRNGSAIANCAAINKTISAKSAAGRIAGYADGGTITNNFALTTMTAANAAFNTNTRNHGVSKADAELKRQSTYSDPINGDGMGGLG